MEDSFSRKIIEDWTETKDGWEAQRGSPLQGVPSVRWYVHAIVRKVIPRIRSVRNKRSLSDDSRIDFSSHEFIVATLRNASTSLGHSREVPSVTMYFLCFPSINWHCSRSKKSALQNLVSSLQWGSQNLIKVSSSYALRARTECKQESTWLSSRGTSEAWFGKWSCSLNTVWKLVEEVN